MRQIPATLVILLFPLAAYAQEASISGTITDQTGGVLPGVTITATHVETGNTFVGVTDERGTFRLPLRVGNFRIALELSGFDRQSHDRPPPRPDRGREPHDG